MSLPSFPVIEPPITLNDSLNMILASIAMEELSLSHIMNAEGEKLQYVLGTLGVGKNCGGSRATVDELLEVNRSVQRLLDSIMSTQVILKSKMDGALSAIEDCVERVTGPTGPQGPPGPPGQPCHDTHKCAVALCGCTGRWLQCKPLVWQRSDCARCCNMRLSQCGTKLLLGAGGCCAVNFTVTACLPDCVEGGMEVALIIEDSACKTDKFVCVSAREGDRVTVTGSGIYIPARKGQTELALVLQSPYSVNVECASIYVTEV